MKWIELAVKAVIICLFVALAYWIAMLPPGAFL